MPILHNKQEVKIVGVVQDTGRIIISKANDDGSYTKEEVTLKELEDTGDGSLEETLSRANVLRRGGRTA